MRKPARPWLLWLPLAVAASAAVWFGWQAVGPAPPERMVRVGVYENAPKVYTDASGHPAGLFIELLKAVAHDEHWSIEYVHCTWAACLADLRAGHIDLMPDVAYSSERATYLDYQSLAVAYGWSQVFARPALQIHALPDLAGRRVALLRNGIQQHYFDRLMHSAGFKYTPVLVDSFDAGFRAVDEGRADAVVSNNFYSARHGRDTDLRETPLVFQPISLYFATARGHDSQLLMAIDHHLAAWREDPDSIYFSALRRSMAPTPVEVIPGWLRVILYVAAGLVVLFVVVTLLLRWQVRQRTAALNRTSRDLEEILHANPTVLYRLCERDGRMVPEWVSPNIQRLFGFTQAEVLRQGWWRSQLHPDDVDAALARFDELPEQGTVAYEYRIHDAVGATRYIRDEMHVTPPSRDRPRTIFGTWSDLTESRVQAQRVDFLTHHDPLTHLPNRMHLNQRLTQAIERARQQGTELAVLSIDLDRFKNINDTLGHSVGDAFLRSVAMSMRNIIAPGDLLARVGGDEFVVLLEQGVTAHHASAVAQRILSKFSAPTVIGEHELVVTASVGISFYPANGDDADTLMRHAELALYEAKNQGRNTWCFFDYRLSTGVLERLVMESTLRGAIERDELVLHYQPQVALDSGRPLGVEALLRWKHPHIGLLPPGQFIGLAEEGGMISQIGAWVLGEACRQMMAWRLHGMVVPRMSVNLSVQQIERSELGAQVERTLAQSGLDAGSLELELTESTIMREPERAMRTLAELKKLGVKLSIDDFGTGHSSLAYLKRLPLDRLKIDRSFVRDIGRDPDDEAISRAVIELARRLGLETVAEGVEREEQAEFLRREGCNAAQGFLFCKPLPADELVTYWARHVAAVGTHLPQD